MNLCGTRTPPCFSIEVKVFWHGGSKTINFIRNCKCTNTFVPHCVYDDLKITCNLPMTQIVYVLMYWNINLAISSYFEEAEGEPESRNSHAEFMRPGSPKPAAPPPNPSRIATFASLKNNDEEDNEEEGQAFYAGGSERRIEKNDFQINLFLSESYCICPVQNRSNDESVYIKMNTIRPICLKIRRTVIIKFGLHASFVELKSSKNALNGVTRRIDDKNSVFALLDLDLKFSMHILIEIIISVIFISRVMLDS
ncbi:UNVERIFIED_CONTAM: hypothetical protein NCL1_53838 [Trichonephila clavipes]